MAEVGESFVWRASIADSLFILTLTTPLTNHTVELSEMNVSYEPPIESLSWHLVAMLIRVQNTRPLSDLA